MGSIQFQIRDEIRLDLVLEDSQSVPQSGRNVTQYLVGPINVSP